MSYDLSTVLSFAVIVSVVIGWIRFKKINPAFIPFVLVITCGFLHELISLIAISQKYSNAIVYNIYSLIESILILILFRKWKIIKFNTLVFRSLVFGLTIIWILEIVSMPNFETFCSYFTIAYSFIIVLLSINTINALINQVKNSLVKNSNFLICVGFVIYFTYSIIVEAFWMYGLNENHIFQSKVYDILVIINLFVNLLYAVAVLWIPTKPKFILQS